VVTIGEDLSGLKTRAGRLRQAALIALVGFALVVLRMQLVCCDYWRAQAENNHLRRQEIKAERGLIRDRAGRLLAGNRASYGVYLIPELAPNPEASLVRAAAWLGLDETERERRRPKLRDT
jgi:penicillin-binding protein 2